MTKLKDVCRRKVSKRSSQNIRSRQTNASEQDAVMVRYYIIAKNWANAVCCPQTKTHVCKICIEQQIMRVILASNGDSWTINICVEQNIMRVILASNGDPWTINICVERKLMRVILASNGDSWTLNICVEQNIMRVILASNEHSWTIQPKQPADMFAFNTDPCESGPHRAETHELINSKRHVRVLNYEIEYDCTITLHATEQKRWKQPTQISDACGIYTSFANSWIGYKMGFAWVDDKM